MTIAELSKTLKITNEEIVDIMNNLPTVFVERNFRIKDPIENTILTPTGAKAVKERVDVPQKEVKREVKKEVKKEKVAKNETTKVKKESEPVKEVKRTREVKSRFISPDEIPISILRKYAIEHNDIKEVALLSDEQLRKNFDYKILKISAKEYCIVPKDTKIIKE